MPLPKLPKRLAPSFWRWLTGLERWSRRYVFFYVLIRSCGRGPSRRGGVGSRRHSNVNYGSGIGCEGDVRE